MSIGLNPSVLLSGMVIVISEIPRIFVAGGYKSANNFQQLGNDLDAALIFTGQLDGLKVRIVGLEDNFHMPPCTIFEVTF